MPTEYFSSVAVGLWCVCPQGALAGSTAGEKPPQGEGPVCLRTHVPHVLLACALTINRVFFPLQPCRSVEHTGCGLKTKEVV